MKRKYNFKLREKEYFVFKDLFREESFVLRRFENSFYNEKLMWGRR